MKKMLLILLPILLACATTGMQKKAEEAPIRTKIEAPKEKVYQITATKLMEYGFELESSDPVLGRIKTGFVDLDAPFMGGVLLKMLGAKDFKASITTLIAESDSGYCDLIMRGVGQYKIDDETKHQPVRKDSYTYKQMLKISAEVKEESEK